MSDEETHIWVRTTPSLDGKTYVVTIEASEDRAETLTPRQAMAHAYGVLAAAERADYDAAVFAQMMNVINDEKLSGQIINDLRKDRPPLPSSSTYPLILEPGVSAFTKEPFLTISLAPAKKGDPPKPVGQWTVPAARDHAVFVMTAVQAADNDAGYYRVLTGTVGIDEGRARVIIDELAQHRLQS